jgi:hypothetical protein
MTESLPSMGLIPTTEEKTNTSIAGKDCSKTQFQPCDFSKKSFLGSLLDHKALYFHSCCPSALLSALCILSSSQSKPFLVS